MRNLDQQIDYWDRVGPGKPFNHPVNLARLNQYLEFNSYILDYGFVGTAAFWGFY